MNSFPPTGGSVMSTDDEVPRIATSRLSAPRPLSAMLSRPRVLKLLDEAATGRLTTVIGGPGTGKTSAVADWTRGASPQIPSPGFRWTE